MHEPGSTAPRANWQGLFTHTAKEVLRFVKVAQQTLIAPIVTALLFLAVLAIAFGRGGESIAGVGFAAFLAPGLAMMALVQNAFSNSSTSIIVAKMQGNIVDVLMAPLSPAELALGYALGGALRGIAVVASVMLAMWAFVPVRIHDPAMIVYHAVAAAFALSLLGTIAGIWAERIDNQATITNFVVTPLAFLSGTFYSIEHLPATWRVLAQLDPMFYMIDGFRYGFIGHADGSLGVGIALALGLNLALWLLCWRLFATGYKLKA